MKTAGFTLLLAVLTVSECSGQIVGVRGQNITLPCSYDIKYHGALSVCWGREDIPNSGCNRQIIALDGQTVRESTRLSSRYQLLGPLDQGDVSLTILNLTDEDAGRYGCRVEVKGWFNDNKHHIDLVIGEQASASTTSTPPDNETTTEQTTVNSTAADQLSSSLNPMTSWSESVQAEESSSSVSIVVMCVVLGVVALVTAGGLVIAAKRWNILKKISPQQQVISTVQFNSTTSALQLHRHSSAVENIYQIDGGEYESCP